MQLGMARSTHWNKQLNPEQRSAIKQALESCFQSPQKCYLSRSLAGNKSINSETNIALNAA